MSRAAEDASFLGDQGIDMTGSDEVDRRAGGINQCPNGSRPLRCRDSRLGGLMIDRNRIRRAVGIEMP